MPLPKFDKMKAKAESAMTAMTEQSQAINEMVEKLNTPVDNREEKAANIKIVPRDKIVFHEHNNYSQTSIEKLAETLLRDKVQNIPSGYYDEEKDVYVVENGERRTRAIDYLIGKFNSENVDRDSEEYRLYEKNIKAWENGYAFNVVEKLVEGASRIDEIKSLLRLEDANLEARNNPEERATHIQKRIELLKEYNDLVDQGKHINIPEAIAETFGISERQAFKYAAVSNGLIPELQEEFREKNINLNSAASLASLPEETQRLIVQVMRAGNQDLDIAEIKKIQEELERQKAESERFILEKEEIIRLLSEE